MTRTVPSGWSEVALRDLMTESDDRVGERVDLPLLSITKYDGAVLAKDRFSRVLASKDLSRYRVARRDTVVIDPMLLWDGVIARQHRFDEGVVSPDYRVFKLSTEADSAFFDYLAHSSGLRRQYAQAARGTNVRRRRISRDDFLAIRAAVPPLPEQREIATVLEAVDDAISSGEGVVEQLDRVRRELAEDLLRHGLPGRHSDFHMSELGRIPATWRAARLGDVLLGIDAGWSPACDPQPAGDGEWGVLKVSAVSWGRFLPNENKRLPEGLAPRPELAVQKGDLIVSRANTKELVGRAAVVEEALPRLLLCDKLLRLRVAPDAESAFINATFASARARRQIEDSATGSSRSMKNISQEALRQILIPVPPLDEQQAIVDALRAVEVRADKERAVLVERRRLKTALADALLTGRIRVPVPDGV